MTVADEQSVPVPVPAQKRGKSPGRVAAMKALNASGRGGWGGRRPKHGRAALLELLKRGLENGGDEISALHQDLVSAYVSDLGGAQDCSNMELSVIKRLVALDLDQALLLSTRDSAARLSFEKRLALSQAINRNSSIYFQGIKTLGGPARRPAKSTGEIQIRRFAET